MQNQVFPALGFAAPFIKMCTNKALRLLGIPPKLFSKRIKLPEIVEFFLSWVQMPLDNSLKVEESWMTGDDFSNSGLRLGLRLGWGQNGDFTMRMVFAYGLFPVSYVLALLESFSMRRKKTWKCHQTNLS